MLVKDAAAEAAEQTLRELWDGEFPIDPRKLAKAQGIKVEFARLLEDISGAIVARPGDVTILVEETQDFTRQRFTIAHELGHYFERVIAGDAEYSFVERRGGNGYSLHELYADTYAANLLMPEFEFRTVYEMTSDVSQVAEYFAVSKSAAQMRINKLGLI
ncbi:uncharacterized protein DUF955 [Arthrobacter sp. AG1021]|uniref:ImmA/IrrE family metallo-endopeptidase n=1 Tax=Arthrobacter sp. AG1021 TaxID=2183908 RepID=UPI000EB547B1|nr:ImmA/IrrE family metallo-endopeptidase [Arthrobacter sp. AG1021]RKS16704.1 uncharacterized protein DUF955 [Arthrobacter sp. AG1021]